VKSRSRKGGPLSAQTVKHCYGVLHAALGEAVKLELLARNVADAAAPPLAKADEVEKSLAADQMTAVLDALRGSRIHPIVSLALATDMRRGELLALRWRDVDPGRSAVAVERSLANQVGRPEV
jgi:integrase